MSREPRLVLAGTALHITARRNYRHNVFDPENHAGYLNLLARYAASEGLQILGWCLMSNHVHLLGVPEHRDALARTMKRTQADHAQRVNRRQGRRAGHLWQSRYYSCPMAGDAVWTVLRYIELNPVRAGLAPSAEQYA